MLVYIRGISRNLIRARIIESASFYEHSVIGADSEPGEMESDNNSDVGYVFRGLGKATHIDLLCMGWDKFVQDTELGPLGTFPRNDDGSYWIEQPRSVYSAPSTPRSIEFQTEDKDSISPNFDGEVPNGPTGSQPISSPTTKSELQPQPSPSAAIEAAPLSINIPSCSAHSENPSTQPLMCGCSCI